MEYFADWFYHHINPWSSEEHLAYAAVAAFVLMTASTVAILILAFVAKKNQISSGKIYFAVTSFCTPLFSFAMSLLFKWVVSAVILTLIFAAVFFSAKQKKEAFETKKNFACFYLANVMLPNLIIILLSLSGLPYKLL